jgi:hypothetical protein
VYTNNNEESVTHDNFSIKSFTLAMNSVYLLALAEHAHHFLLFEKRLSDKFIKDYTLILSDRVLGETSSKE